MKTILRLEKYIQHHDQVVYEFWCGCIIICPPGERLPAKTVCKTHGANIKQSLLRCAICWSVFANPKPQRRYCAVKACFKDRQRDYQIAYNERG